LVDCYRFFFFWSFKIYYSSSNPHLVVESVVRILNPYLYYLLFHWRVFQLESNQGKVDYIFSSFLLVPCWIYCLRLPIGDSLHTQKLLRHFFSQFLDVKLTTIWKVKEYGNKFSMWCLESPTHYKAKFGFWILHDQRLLLNKL
jgi:hypothetical protein